MAGASSGKRGRDMSKKRSLVEQHMPPPVHTSVVLPMRGLCPLEDAITDFDRRNMTLYTLLLIAEEDGTGIEEIASEILHFDLRTNRAWAIRVTLSYLQRARWVHDQIFPTLG